MEYLNILLIIFLIYAVFRCLYLNNVDRQDSTNSVEYFDTYRNHNDFANSYYEENNPKILSNDKPTMDETDLYASYMWNDKDNNGLNIYDKYYETLNLSNYNEPKLPNYPKGERDDPYIIKNGQKITLNQAYY